MTQRIQEVSRRYKRKKIDSPLEPEERMLLLASWEPFQFSDFQKCKITNFCCLKPINL